MKAIFSRMMAVVAVAGMTLFGLSSCAGKVADDTETATSSVASFESSAEMSHVSSIFGDAIQNLDAESQEAYLEQTAANIQAALEAAFVGCVTPYPDDKDPTTVGATFNCTGTNGLFAITGTIQGTLVPTMQGIKVVGSSLKLSTQDLVVSGRGVVGTADLVYTEATGKASLKMDFEVDDLKVGLVHVLVDGILQPTETCLKFDGNISGEGDNLTFNVVVTGFERCEGSCPTAGGKAEVQFTDADGSASLTISFDGTENAQVSSSRGRTFQVPLTCAK